MLCCIVAYRLEESAHHVAGSPHAPSFAAITIVAKGTPFDITLN
jgi:hypothetical protein